MVNHSHMIVQAAVQTEAVMHTCTDEALLLNKLACLVVFIANTSDSLLYVYGSFFWLYTVQCCHFLSF